MGVELLLQMASSTHPDRVALGSRAGGLTYGDLARAAAGRASLIGQAHPRDIAFIGVNGPVVPVLIFAAARAGVPVSLLGTIACRPGSSTASWTG
jgi:acyl-CoA synthetase (AMP-forming)/AMP-acid ligase II